MICKRKRPIPHETVASDAEPGRKDVRTEEDRRLREQDEQKQDPRVEPIERR